MATMNPFDLLGDNDNDDPSQLIESAAQLQKVAPKKTPGQGQGQGQGRGAQAQQQKQAKLPTKPLPPAQAGELPILLFLLVFLYCVCFTLLMLPNTWLSSLFNH